MSEDTGIVVGICSLSHVNMPTVDDIIHIFCQENKHVRGIVTVEASLLPHARNQIIAGAYTRYPKFTDILFIDSDMTNFDSHSVNLLFDSMHQHKQAGIVAGLFTTALPPFKPTARPLNDRLEQILEETTKEKPGLIECKHVGLAFTLVSRKVLDKVGGPNYCSLDRCVDWERLKYELNKDLMRGIEYFRSCDIMGEDVDLCQKARDYGFKVFTHCGCIVSHIGYRPWDVRHYASTLASQVKDETSK